MPFFSLPTVCGQKSVFGKPQIDSKKRDNKNRLGQGILMLVGLFLLTTSGAGSPRPTFHSFLAKNQTNPTPETRFAYNDQISLQTIWKGLTGTHEEMVLWIAPDKKGVYHTNRFTFTIPSGNISYQTTACCLSFNKRKFFLPDTQLIYIGTWTAKLFLDGNFLSEFSFYVS